MPQPKQTKFTVAERFDGAKLEQGADRMPGRLLCLWPGGATSG
jgi:hypothetical protein